jgi:hypothetical protein
MTFDLTKGLLFLETNRAKAGVRDAGALVRHTKSCATLLMTHANGHGKLQGSAVTGLVAPCKQEYPDVHMQQSWKRQTVLASAD